jgi:C-terminal processing protease CtpA/Prc
MPRTDLLERVIQLIDEHYVYPDVARQVAAELRTRSYEGFDDGRQLCDALTADLQRISRDQHLSVRPVDPERADAGHGEEWRTRLKERFARDNHGFIRVEWLDGGVGLLELRCFSEPEWAGDRAVAAMTLLASADALIVDLRRNGGGAPGMVALLTSYLVDVRTLLHSMRSRDPGQLDQSWTLPWVPGPRFGGAKPIWVLTSGKTFSGGEEFAYNLQSLDRATIVGEVTAGAAHPTTAFPVTPTVELNVPTGRPENPRTGTDWEGTGVVPDVAVPAEVALETAHRLAREHLHDMP